MGGDQANWRRGMGGDLNNWRRGILSWRSLPPVLRQHYADVYAAEVAARGILLAHERYRELSPQDQGLRIDVPLHLGNATVVEDRLFLSWMRPEMGDALDRQVCGDPPEFDDWKQAGPLLWLVDVAARIGTSGVWVGRQLGRTLLELGVAAEGERVAFRRHSGRRFGWATVRA